MFLIHCVKSSKIHRHRRSPGFSDFNLPLPGKSINIAMSPIGYFIDAFEGWKPYNSKVFDAFMIMRLWFCQISITFPSPHKREISTSAIVPVLFCTLSTLRTHYLHVIQQIRLFWIFCINNTIKMIFLMLAFFIWQKFVMLYHVYTLHYLLLVSFYVYRLNSI